MSDAYTDRVMKRISDAAAAEMLSLGDEIEQDIRQRVSDGYPPPSEPGTPPHVRTGGYREGFEHAVEQNEGEDTVDLTVSNPQPLALWLERGTSRGLAPRPHFKPTGEDWHDRVQSRVQGAINATPTT